MLKFSNLSFFTLDMFLLLCTYFYKEVGYCMIYCVSVRACVLAATKVSSKSKTSHIQTHGGYESVCVAHGHRPCYCRPHAIIRNNEYLSFS